MEMNDKTVNERRVFATFSQSEIEELLVNAVAAQSGIKVDRNTTIKILIDREDKGISKGFESYAEVSLVNEVVK